MANVIQLESVVYGGKQITNGDILNKISQHLKNELPFLVNNETLGEDPMPGQVKKCTISWRSRPNDPVLSETIEENGYIYFFAQLRRNVSDRHVADRVREEAHVREEIRIREEAIERSIRMDASVKRVEYGGVQVKDPDVINRLNDALRKCLQVRKETIREDPLFQALHIKIASITIDNDSLGGDPSPGLVKQARIWVKHTAYPDDLIWTLNEGDMFPPNIKSLTM